MFTAAKSSIGSVSGVSQLRPTNILVALKAYFDGSYSGASSVTLAGIAASESVWIEFESLWRYVLDDRSAPYLHMNELMSPQGKTFAQWTQPMKQGLVLTLADVIVSFVGNPEFKVFTCTVDMDAHRRYGKKNGYPSPERLCARSLFGFIYEWYSRFPVLILEPLDLFFDRNERFEGHIKSDWNNRKVRAAYPFWELVRTVAPLDMHASPALQCADMIAWCRNRIAADKRISELEIKPPKTISDYFSAMAGLVIAKASVSQVYVDELLLATRRFPGAA